MSETSESQPNVVSREVVTAAMVRTQSVYYPNQAPLVVEVEQADGTRTQAIVRRVSRGRLKDGTVVMHLHVKE